MAITSSKKSGLPSTGEILLVRKEAGNVHDRRAVALLKADGTVVGHVPREVSKIFWHYLGHGGRISREVTGRRKYGKGLEVPCVYKFLGSKKMVEKMRSINYAETLKRYLQLSVDRYYRHAHHAVGVSIGTTEMILKVHEI